MYDKWKNIALIEALGMPPSHDPLLITDPKHRRTINEDFEGGSVGLDELGRTDDVMDLNENVRSKNLLSVGVAVEVCQPL